MARKINPQFVFFEAEQEQNCQNTIYGHAASRVVKKNTFFSRRKRGQDRSWVSSIESQDSAVVKIALNCKLALLLIKKMTEG